MSKIKPFSRVVLRTPTLPVKELENLKKITKEGLFNLFKESSFLQEALLIASPSIYHELVKYLTNENFDPKREKKLLFSLLRYYIRIISRPTPFGLFASCSICEIKDKNSIKFGNNCSFKRSSRIDMSVLSKVSEELQKNKKTRFKTKYFKNPTIYRKHDKYRYVEYYYEGLKRISNITEVDYSPYLQEIINLSEEGVLLDRLIDYLTNEGVDKNNANSFIKEVVDNKILVSELEPTVTGEGFENRLLRKTKNISTDESDLYFNKLEHITNLVSKLDKKNNNKLDIHFKIKNTVEELSIETATNNIIQTDIYRPLDRNHIAKKYVNKVKRGINILRILNSGNRNEKLENFKEEFLKKYGNHEVPLLEALDTENGIGYGNFYYDNSDYTPLLKNINLPLNFERDLKWDQTQKFLLNKYLRALENNEDTIELDESDISHLDKRIEAKLLPDTFSALIKIIKVNGKEEVLFERAGGTSAVNLIGRFCHIDENINELAKEISKRETEKYTDKIIAEVVHLPEHRTGNILLRPALRDFEIPIHAFPSVNQKNTIPLNDITVTIKNNHYVYLRSRKLDKEIIPRISNAHNYSMYSIPAYQFLGDLQTQYKINGMDFNWGALQSNFKKLPRVYYKDVIINPRSWRLFKSDIDSLINRSTSQGKDKALGEWRKRNDIPKEVIIVEGDNELYINFESELLGDLFLDHIANKEEIKISEYFAPADNLVKDNEGNTYANQFIFSFENSSQNTISISSRNHNSKNIDIVDTFAPGNQWIYYKIYVGVKTADNILSDTIGSIISDLMEKALIKKWFFIRYNDESHHIRFRVLLENNSDRHLVIKIINDALEKFLKAKTITKTSINTYKREIKRYGGKGIEIAESFFTIDSNYVLELLPFFKGNQGAEIRWLICIKSLDEYLNNFSMNIHEKSKFARKQKEGYWNEFSFGKSQKIALDMKFRDNREYINKITNGKLFENLDSILKDRSDHMKSITDEIQKMYESDEITVGMNDLLSSYLHMHINRIMKSKQRFQEAVIYYLMDKYYTSEIARMKHMAEKN